MQRQPLERERGSEEREIAAKRAEEDLVDRSGVVLVRLAQQFASIDFTPEVAPASVPPPGYADSPGSDGTDRVWMGSHLTMYAKVCVHCLR